MPGEQESHDDWSGCPQGELSRMVQRLTASQNRAKTKRLFGAATISVLLIAGGIVAVDSFFGMHGSGCGGITCAECREHFAAYRGHVTGIALLEDAGLAQSMAIHLARCGSCRALFNQIYPGVLNTATRPALGRFMPTLAIADWTSPL